MVVRQFEKSVRLISNPISLGIVPVNEFRHNYNPIRPVVRSPVSVGWVPINQFHAKAKKGQSDFIRYTDVQYR